MDGLQVLLRALGERDHFLRLRSILIGMMTGCVRRSNKMQRGGCRGVSVPTFSGRDAARPGAPRLCLTVEHGQIALCRNSRRSCT